MVNVWSKYPIIGFRTLFFRYHRTLSWPSKPSNHPYYFKYDLGCITEYPGGKQNGFCVILIANQNKNMAKYRKIALRTQISYHHKAFKWTKKYPQCFYIASNKVLNTSQSTQEVNKLISEGFRYKLGSKFINFCIFSNCVRSKFSFC